MTLTDNQPATDASTHPPSSAAPAAFRCEAGRYPPMRMPAEQGGVLIDDIVATPTVEVAELSGTWHACLDTVGITDGTLALQLLAPLNQHPDCEQQAHVALWIYSSHTNQWALIRRFNHAGPGWLHQIAPWIAAATAARRVRPA